MKKFVLTTFAIALLSGCATKTDTVKKANFTQQDFVGEWHCLTKYPELSVESYDVIQLKEDGSMTDDANISVVVKESPVLNYHRIAQGKWQFESNNLMYAFTLQKVTKDHPAQTQALLNNQKQVVNHKALRTLKKVDAGLFKSLSNENYKKEKVKLNVLKWTKNYGFSAVQQLNGKNYLSLCLTKEEVNKSVKK